MARDCKQSSGSGSNSAPLGSRQDQEYESLMNELGEGSGRARIGGSSGAAPWERQKRIEARKYSNPHSLAVVLNYVAWEGRGGRDDRGPPAGPPGGYSTMPPRKSTPIPCLATTDLAAPGSSAPGYGPPPTSSSFGPPPGSYAPPPPSYGMPRKCFRRKPST